MTADERARRLFRSTYSTDPEFIVRSPGRVNLIGEHTDYNGGFVLPMAIDSDLVIAVRARRDDRVHAVSESQSESASFSVGSLQPGSGWAEYLKGVAVELATTETLTGWEGAIASDVADGAGLSSSAALELATARAFAEVSDLTWDPTAMALIGQRAENDWVGMNSGVMDQLICATGRAGHARLIDCRDLSGVDVPLIPDTAVVLLDTDTRRSLVGSEYNDRRSDCEEAADQLGLDLLRDATLEMVADAGLDDRLARRARHVVGENLRTVAAANAFETGDAATLGTLMNESHASLRDDFDASSPALDAMARIAQGAPGCFGARQTGGGFAGSCVALVADDLVPGFIERATNDYQTTTGRHGSAIVVAAVDGVQATWIA